MSVNFMFALLNKLRGLSSVTRCKPDEKAWNELHKQTEDNTFVATSKQALEFPLPSDIDSNESHNAANESSNVAIEVTVAQQDTASSTTFPAIGQEQSLAGLTMSDPLSGSSRSPSENPNRVLKAKTGPLIGLDVSHLRATGSAQEEAEPPKETSLENPSDAHSTGHRGAQTVALGDISEQKGKVDSTWSRDNLPRGSKTGNLVVQASPGPVDDISPPFASNDIPYLSPTSSPPVPLKGILKYRKGVMTAQRPSIEVTQKSNTPAHEVFVGRDSTQEDETQGGSDAKLGNEKPPSMSAKLEDLKVDQQENDVHIRKQCDDRYKDVDSREIGLEFEQRRIGHQNKKEKEARTRQVRGQIPRGQHNYCSHRAVTSKPREYRSTLRSLPCKCGVPHAILDAKEWRSSPAEDIWDHSLPQGGNPVHKTRNITFAEPVVTKTQAFEEWWEDDYGLSDRFYSRGPFLHKSEDLATKADDEQEIQSLGNLAPQLSCSLRRAASNAIANNSDLNNSPAKRNLNRLIAMAAKPHRGQHTPSKRTKRLGEKQRNRRTRNDPIGPSKKAKVSSPTDAVFTANLLPSSDSYVVRSTAEHQDNVDQDKRGENVTKAPGKRESEFAGEAAGSPASTDERCEPSSTVTSTPSQQCADGVGDDYPSETALRPLRAWRDRGDSRGLRSPGPQYGGRRRWSPYHLTGPRKRHRAQGEESDEELLMDMIVNAALEQELALQADELREVPLTEELPMSEAIANAALEHELSLQADVEREVPTMEKLSLHVAAGAAKIKEWWNSLERSHASRAAPVFPFRSSARTEDSEVSYYMQSDTWMTDAQEDSEISDPEVDAEMSDAEEDSEMSDAEDNIVPIWPTAASLVQRVPSTSGFGAGTGQMA